MSSTTKQNNQLIINETGKTMQQWFNELEKREFQCIHWKKQVELLVEDYQLDLSWAEYISEAYCSLHGVPWKDKDNKGYSILVTKTFHHPYKQVRNLTQEGFSMERRACNAQKIDENRRKYQWSTDDSDVSVQIESKGDEKTRVIVRHDHLSSEVDAEVMRNFWKSQISGFVETL